jgi:hypothetical protein
MTPIAFARSRAFMASCCLLLLPLTTEARLHESLAECTRRYGEPTKVSEQEYMFKKAGITIRAFLFQGKVERLQFVRDPEQQRIAPGFTENEIEILKKANGGGKVWKKLEHYTDPLANQLEGSDLLMTEDGAAYAAFSRVGNRPTDKLLMVTAAALKRSLQHADDGPQRLKQQEAERLKDF